MAKGKVVQDDVSRFGLRRIHLISMAGRVVEPLVPEGWMVVKRLEYEDEDIGVHHLWLFMKTTETPGSEPG